MRRVAVFDNCFVIAETDAAILVEIDDEEHWIPKSQIHDNSEVYASGTEGQLIVSEWLAEKKGLV